MKKLNIILYIILSIFLSSFAYADTSTTYSTRSANPGWTASGDLANGYGIVIQMNATAGTQRLDKVCKYQLDATPSCIIYNHTNNNKALYNTTWVNNCCNVSGQNIYFTGDVKFTLGGWKTGGEQVYYNNTVNLPNQTFPAGDYTMWRGAQQIKGGAPAETETAIYTIQNFTMTQIDSETSVARPIIEQPSPENNANNNTQVILNVSHPTTNNDVRYYLYFGNFTPLNESHLIYTNVTRNASEYSYYKTSVEINADYYWKWKVQNITDGEFSANTTERMWTFDGGSPTITFGSNNGFNLDNTTKIQSFTDNLILNISIFDTNLLSSVINITNSTDGVLYNLTNATIAGTTINYTNTIDLSNVHPQNLTIKIKGVDGSTNTIIKNYQLEVTGVVNITAYDPILNRQLNFTSILDGVTKHSSESSTNSTQYNNISGPTRSLFLNVSGYGNYNASINLNDPFNSFRINMYIDNVLDNCSTYSNKVITLVGKDEETDIGVNNTELDITVYHAPSLNVSNIKNTSFIFRGAINYSICTNYNQTFLIDSIMQYGDGTTYTKKKYYINNMSVNTSIENVVYLYHLNNSKASEITFSVFDKITGDKVPSAFIKVLRYYPGENVFRTVEIVKTDEVGQSLGKMVLADVFYKFIIEQPAGTIRITTDTLRILSLSRSFGISFVTDVLDTWDKIHGISSSVTCTKSTATCRFTWSDSSNIVQYAVFEVWRSNGISDTLLYTQTTASTAGTMSYTIAETTDGNSYTAKGFIESNTGTSYYNRGIAGLIYSNNPFFTNEDHRLASIFPLFLLALVIVFALIDFGVIGVVIGSLLGLIIGSVLGLLPLDPFYFISFIIMGAILIYKLSR